MNIQKVREIIKLYKQYFPKIHREEIYKWQAVKCFQDNWDINASDFYSMLERSLHLSKNLLDSKLYYPKAMLLEFTEINPKLVRQLFIDLYNEDEDLIERIISFKERIKQLNSKYKPDKNDYQDLRAVLVYLCLHYPDRYYFYKTKMFKEFVEAVDYPYEVKKGSPENITQYLTLCNLLKAEILRDNELLELHRTRITEREFFDSSFNILTQDVIYAVRHFAKLAKVDDNEHVSKRLIRVEKKVLPKTDKVILKGSFTNFIENEKENRRIGELGELLVYEHEQEKLKSLGIKKKPEHKSKSEGDGLGYDILSYDEKGNEMFIEVKTTKKNYNTPIFITRNELLRSSQDKDKFYLYRLYEFDDTNNKAKYYKRQGEMTDLCDNPILYRAILD